MYRWLILLVAALVLTLTPGPSPEQKRRKTNTPKKKTAGKPTSNPPPTPPNTVTNLDVHPELEATLFAHEDVLKPGEKRDLDKGGLTNPTNLDIDHKGRIWVCDVMNYRGNNGRRPNGDRILIYNPDGSMKVFYQGRDVDSAMGICVLGNKVIVSCSPNVFVFTKDDNDKIIKKEVLFTKTGIPQHDHSAHSFVFGPDGRLYWNFGNTGQAVHDKFGKPVIDVAGNVVNASGKPYRQGMVFRCEMDGSNFEVLGHNFRNNYEVAVDSFGTLWQSDNDDDGNKGVRINYVMEYGNFGYVDEMTGAGWQAKRTNMEKEIPLRHWHLNDPGVVPNLLQTYAGSPTGICVYEGTLLPKVFHNQIIHCDALPSVVRSYPVVPDGAGYKVTQTVNILDGAKKNNWFRPADVCVAPDGSLFVTDWYDPGVGGHQQRDQDRGRIFRVAPKGHKYAAPAVKFDTIEDNIEALKSPNGATRYIAWTNLHKAGAKAEPALLKLYESKVPHERARALWLLGRIPNNGELTVRMAFRSEDPDLRIVGLRLARQLKLDVIPWIKAGVHDVDSAVRRECVIGLRHHTSKEAAALWAEFAQRHDGKDRWELEALGIGAAGNWDACLEHYMMKGPSRSLLSKQTRDIVWRSRGVKTPTLLATAISFPQIPADELPRLMRAFDFQKDSDIKTEALIRLAFATYSDPERGKFITTEALSRLKNFDVAKNPKHATALDKVLDGMQGTPLYVELVGKFNVSKRYGSLLTIAQNQPNDQLGIDAMTLLLERDAKLALPGLKHPQINVALATVQAMGNAAHVNANPLLRSILLDSKADLELRRQATRALGKNKPGAQELINRIKSRDIDKFLHVAASSVLLTSTAKDIRAEAEKLFPPPTGKDKKPVPAISDLAKQRGNASNGAIVFAKVGTCAKCHQVNGEGKNVGPDLSEIGKKLAREALYEAILYPSASIAHSYEMWIIETKKGTQFNGLLVSKTGEEISIKDAESIVRTFKISEVDFVQMSPISLMPADLHVNMTTQELVDVVEYLVTLKEARKK